MNPQRGRIVVVTNIAATEVVTVLWHRLDGRHATPLPVAS